MLHYITFYYTFSANIIVSHLKVPSLQILHTEHYRVNLCQSETILFLVITFPALENKRSLATDTAGTASSRLATAATDGYFWWFVAHQDSGFCLCKRGTRAKVLARRGKLPAVNAWSVATRRREWQTTPIQHCWASQRSVCPTDSTPVWGRLQMQWTTAVRRRCWQQLPANDVSAASEVGEQ